MRILDYAMTQGWAMLPERAEELSAVAQRLAEPGPEAMEAYRAAALNRSERAGRRDSVAILHVDGPLFKKANLFVEISGATSYEILRRDLQVALDDPSIHSILLVVDSPGGEANGCDELASAIYAARGKKSITAYVSGMAASGGYWIASAAERVIVSDAAILGSIGVVLGMQDRSEAEAKRGVKSFQFVSSRSPGKRPDPKTDAGRDRIQSMVDDLADVFIDAVAKHRGVDHEKVVHDFGGGGVKIGAKAVSAGMADEIGQLEATIQSLIRKQQPAAANRGRSTHAETSEHAADSAVFRIRTIMEAPLAAKHPALAQHLALKTRVSADECLGILDAAEVTMVAARSSQERKKSSAPKDPGAAYLLRKTQAGTLGTEHGMSVDPSFQASWKRAVARANGSLTSETPNKENSK